MHDPRGEAIVKEFWEAWNAHDVERCLAQFAEDGVFETSVGPEPWGTRNVGKAAIQAAAEKMFADMPDVRWEPLQHFAYPEVAGAEFHVRATLPDGKPLDVQGVDLLYLKDGLIAVKKSFRKTRTTP